METLAKEKGAGRGRVTDSCVTLKTSPAIIISKPVMLDFLASRVQPDPDN